jgi:hypothetical protein
MKYVSLITAALFVPQMAQAQVARRLFTFLDNDVTVEVATDAPGTLQIVRGEDGQIDVAARVPGGLSSAALGGRESDRLRLTAVGGSRADFIVTVPEDTYVRVYLPNHKAGSLASTRGGGSYTWEGRNPQPVVAQTTALPTGPFIAHTTERTPHTISIPNLSSIHTVSVHFGASAFQIVSANAMSVIAGDPDNLEIRTGDRHEDIQITIPADIRNFTFRLGGRTALTANFGEITAYCDPLSEQDMGGRARWFTFTPEAGRINCR